LISNSVALAGAKPVRSPQANAVNSTTRIPREAASGPASPERRGFLKALAASALALASLLTPILAGLRAFLNPLRSSGFAETDFVKVAMLSALPVNGPPWRCTIVVDRTNAWNRMPSQPAGAVFLRRTAEAEVTAFNVVCPHAGCNVDYSPDRNSYLCPCHNSTFALDGAINDPKSPSPRGLDALEVELRDGAVWVRFQNFRAGLKEKAPV
jgi:menaquinol-cytochrome c reductase iron-sulfur subunit